MSIVKTVVGLVESEFPRVAVVVLGAVDALTGSHVAQTGAVDWAAVGTAVVSLVASGKVASEWGLIESEWERLRQAKYAVANTLPIYVPPAAPEAPVAPVEPKA
jgi:hypothetical protein